MFLSPEEKLQKIRKKYKITQGDLVGNDVTRVFLGMIEIGKRSLTEKTAKVLCKNFHKIFKEKGIKDKIILEDLMKSKQQQAIDFLNNMLKSEIDISDDNIWIIEEALYELEPNDRSEFCEKLYTRFLTRHRPELAKRYLLKSLHGVRKIPNLKKRLSDLFLICEEINDPESAVFTYKRFLPLLPKEKFNKETELLNYYYAKTLSKIGAYSEALEVAELLIKKSKNTKLVTSTRKLVAIIYYKQNKIDDSIKMYSSIAKSKANLEKCLYLCEIIEIAIEKDKKEIAKKFFDRTKSLFINSPDVNNYEFAIDIYSTLAKGGKFLGKNKDAKEFLMQALVLARTTNKSDLERITIISEIFDVIDRSDFFSVKSIEAEYLTLYKTTKNLYPAIKILDYYQKNHPEEFQKNTMLLEILSKK